MKAMKCELCGSGDVVKKDGFFVCQYCGAKYSVEEAKKIIGTVKIDKSQELENLYQLARRAKANDDGKDAVKYYEMILLHEPDNWEAQFYHIFYDAWQCLIKDIAAAAQKVVSVAKSSLTLIEDIDNQEERQAAVDEIASQVIRMSVLLTSAASNHYNSHKSAYGIANSFSNQIVNLHEMCYATAEKIYNSDKLTDKRAKKAQTYLYKQAIATLYSNSSLVATNRVLITSELKKIREVDGTYNLPKRKGCYIATCIYGSYDCLEVWTLRRYRDASLSGTWYGRAFIQVYYKTSPAIVKWFGDSDRFRSFWRRALNRKIGKLNNRGVSSLPYEDRK